MALIETGPIAINAKAIAQAKIVLITIGAGISSAKSTASGRQIAIIKSAGKSASAVVSTVKNSVIIKTAKGQVDSIATAQARDFTKYKTVAGASNAVATVELYRVDRDIQQDVSDYLPQFYQDFAQVVAQLRTTANESTRMQAKLRELLDQFYVETSTLTLKRWEDVTDIEWIPQRSVDSQRHFIMAKLRGTGTVTVELLKEIADAFYEFDVEEEAAKYEVNFKLVSRRGKPKNLEDIEAAIDDVIPAHIKPNFEFTYLPWSEVTAAKLTWEQADTYTAEGLEEAYLL